jgi:hypothetical protein
MFQNYVISSKPFDANHERGAVEAEFAFRVALFFQFPQLFKSTTLVTVQRFKFFIAMGIIYV